MNDRDPVSPWGIICPEHGKQGFSSAEYDHQMARPNQLWRCPVSGCYEAVMWDDERYEASLSEEP